MSEDKQVKIESMQDDDTKKANIETKNLSV